MKRRPVRRRIAVAAAALVAALPLAAAGPAEAAEGSKDVCNWRVPSSNPPPIYMIHNHDYDYTHGNAWDAALGARRCVVENFGWANTAGFWVPPNGWVKVFDTNHRFILDVPGGLRGKQHWFQNPAARYLLESY